MDIASILKDLPHSSGVYIMYGASGQILYVGKAKDLFKRVHQYFGNKANRTEKVLKLVAKVDDIKYIITRSEVEALVLENNLIKKHKPPYNILLKDDKSYQTTRAIPLSRSTSRRTSRASRSCAS